MIIHSTKYSFNKKNAVSPRANWHWAAKSTFLIIIHPQARVTSQLNNRSKSQQQQPCNTDFKFKGMKWFQIQIDLYQNSRWIQETLMTF